MSIQAFLVRYAVGNTRLVFEHDLVATCWQTFSQASPSENGTTIHLFAQNKNVGITMDSSIPLLPDIQATVIHLSS